MTPLKITNTQFKKQDHNIATYRINKETTTRHEPITTQTHAQIDYILTARRWRNSITGVESQTRANIQSDHFPLVFTTRIRLKQIGKGGEPRPIYKPGDSTQQEDLNYELWNTIPTDRNNNNRYKVIKDLLEQGTTTLPKATPKDRNKKYELSYTSKEILEQRKNCER